MAFESQPEYAKPATAAEIQLANEGKVGELPSAMPTTAAEVGEFVTKGSAPEQIASTEVATEQLATEPAGEGVTTPEALSDRERGKQIFDRVTGFFQKRNTLFSNLSKTGEQIVQYSQRVKGGAQESAMIMTGKAANRGTEMVRNLTNRAKEVGVWMQNGILAAGSYQEARQKQLTERAEARVDQFPESTPAHQVSAELLHDPAEDLLDESIDKLEERREAALDRVNQRFDRLVEQQESLRNNRANLQAYIKNKYPDYQPPQFVARDSPKPFTVVDQAEKPTPSFTTNQTTEQPLAVAA